MSTVDPLSAAVERLRASVDALPEWAKNQPWRQGDLEDGAVVDRYGWVLWRPPGGAPVATHFALTADPHKVLLLAALLAAISEHDQADDPHEWETCFIAVRHAADALASHLTKGSTDATA